MIFNSLVVTVREISEKWEDMILIVLKIMRLWAFAEEYCCLEVMSGLFLYKLFLFCLLSRINRVMTILKFHSSLSQL